MVLLTMNVTYFAWLTLGIGTANAQHAQLRQPSGPPLLLWTEWERDSALQAQEQKPQATSVAAAKTAAAPTANRGTPKACYTLGPFYLVHDVSRAATDFETRGATTQQRAAAERKQGGYWVFIPPLPSLQNARNTLRELKTNNVDDLLIIAEGRKENAISVGVFSSQVKAEQRRNEIARFGFTANIEPLQHTQPLYWLDIELWKQTTLPDDLWRKMASDFPNLSQQRRACQ